MEKRQLPSTQQLLLDHLRRIVEGVEVSEPPPGSTIEERWHFGRGEDSLVSYDYSGDDPETASFLSKQAQDDLLGKFLGIEGKDQLRVPSSWHDFKDQFDNKSLEEIASFIEKLLPENAKTEELQLAFAYELLKKLDDIVDRSRKAVQKRHLLSRVPVSVNSYITEAASCFRYGLDVSCIILCRVTLEEALRKRIKESKGGKWTQVQDKGSDKWVEADLYELTRRAEKLKILQLDFISDVHHIRMSGNEYVHGKARNLERLKTLASEILSKTRFLVSVLFG